MRFSPKCRRSMLTTSWLVTPAGLSMTAIPWTVGGLRLAILFRDDRRARVLTEDPVDPLRGPDDVVRPELEDRRLLRSDLSRDSVLQPDAVATEAVEDLGISGFSPQRIEEHDCVVHLRIDVDRRDRDELQRLVVDRHELLGDHLAKRLVEA